MLSADVIEHWTVLASSLMGFMTPLLEFGRHIHISMFNLISHKALWSTNCYRKAWERWGLWWAKATVLDQTLFYSSMEIIISVQSIILPIRENHGRVFCQTVHMHYLNSYIIEKMITSKHWPKVNAILKTICTTRLDERHSPFIMN